jgi:uncharacterized membrane protein
MGTVGSAGTLHTAPARRGVPAVVRTLAWGLVVVLALRFVSKNALQYVTTFDAATYGPFWDRAPWLLLHITTGMAALFAGLAQFWTGARRRHMRVHRWTGRAYLAAIAVSSLVAIRLVAGTKFGWVYGAGLLGLVLAWVSTSGLAYAAIRRRDVAQHREWVTRSYVVTFAFVTFRALFDTLGALQVGTPPERLAVAAWFCWSVPLLVTELVLQGRKVLARG